MFGCFIVYLSQQILVYGNTQKYLFHKISDTHLIQHTLLYMYPI